MSDDSGQERWSWVFEVERFRDAYDRPLTSGDLGWLCAHRTELRIWGRFFTLIFDHASARLAGRWRGDVGAGWDADDVVAGVLTRFLLDCDATGRPRYHAYRGRVARSFGGLISQIAWNDATRISRRSRERPAPLAPARLDDVDPREHGRRGTLMDVEVRLDLERHLPPALCASMRRLTHCLYQGDSLAQFARSEGISSPTARDRLARLRRCIEGMDGKALYRTALDAERSALTSSHPT